MAAWWVHERLRWHPQARTQLTSTPNTHRISRLESFTDYSQDEEFGHFPGGSEGKESVCNAGDPGSIPVSGRAPDRGEDSYPLQDCYLGNPTDRGAWRATYSPRGHRVGHDEGSWAHTQSLLSSWILFFQLVSCTLSLKGRGELLCIWKESEKSYCWLSFRFPHTFKELCSLLMYLTHY